MILGFSDSLWSIRDGRSENETFSLHLVPGGRRLASTGDICCVCVVGVGMGVVTGPDQVRPGRLKLLQYTGLPHSSHAMGRG